MSYIPADIAVISTIRNANVILIPFSHCVMSNVASTITPSMYDIIDIVMNGITISVIIFFILF